MLNVNFGGLFTSGNAGTGLGRDKAAAGDVKGVARVKPAFGGARSKDNDPPEHAPNKSEVVTDRTKAKGAAGTEHGGKRSGPERRG